MTIYSVHPYQNQQMFMVSTPTNTNGFRPITTGAKGVGGPAELELFGKYHPSIIG